MHLTNIHVAAAQAAEPDQTARLLPRLRTLTNDPAREYEQRPGKVERLPDSIAALILCKKGFSKVQRNGIVVEGVTRKPLRFWSGTSVTIEEKAGTNEKVLWTLNRLQPDLLHILKPDGEYVETIPLDGKVAWFDQAATQKVLGEKRRSRNRIIARVQELHAPDSEDAEAAATANEATMRSVVHTFPHDDHKAQLRGKARSIEPETVRAPLSVGQRSNLGNHRSEKVELPSRAEVHARSSARGAFGKADRIHEIQRHLDGARKNHEDRVHVRKQAAAFGSAISSSRIHEPKSQTAAATPTEIEEW